MRLFILPAVVACCALIPGMAMAADGDAGKEVKPYPLKTCIVSGEELGSMGKPVVMVHKGQEVKFCCKSCIKKFNKDPDGLIAKALAGK